MSLLKQHRLIWLFVGLVLATLVALFVVYDGRSPVSQFVHGYGTVPVDRWTAADLEAACIRVEPAQGTPLLWADEAVPVAKAARPDAHVREVVLALFRDTCNGAKPRLAWAVVLQWSAAADSAASPSAQPRPPRAIVIVDAVSGDLILSHAESQP
jgi:hypothetical protein